MFRKYKQKFYRKVNFRTHIRLLPKRGVLYEMYDGKIEPLIYDLKSIFS